MSSHSASPSYVPAARIRLSRKVGQGTLSIQASWGVRRWSGVGVKVEGGVRGGWWRRGRERAERQAGGREMAVRVRLVRMPRRVLYSVPWHLG